MDLENAYSFSIQYTSLFQRWEARSQGWHNRASILGFTWRQEIKINYDTYHMAQHLNAARRDGVKLSDFVMSRNPYGPGFAKILQYLKTTPRPPWYG
jgi:hypothetical protein